MRGARVTIMPRGPQGQWRPAAPIACAVHVGRIATGEIEETYEPSPQAKLDPAVTRARARKGGKARAKALSSVRRSEIAKAAATARWK